ncbi:MAG TPA: hypothetical protein VF457_03705 [Burkholderiaceae bacterium]
MNAIHLPSRKTTAAGRRAIAWAGVAGDRPCGTHRELTAPPGEGDD